MMCICVSSARSGLRSIEDQVLRENRMMLDMGKELHFEIRSIPDMQYIRAVRLMR
jgi:hypothetical protein